MVKVSIVKCDNYNVDKIYHAIKKTLKDINFEIKNGINVLIKPNVLAGNEPKKATVTHPVFIEAICKILKEKDCKISIGDSSAYYEEGFTMENFRKIGIDKVAKKYGAKLIAFEAEDIVKANKHKSRIFKDIFITSLYDKFDLIINAPKLKVHVLAKISGAVKNIYGMIPGGIKQTYHDKIGNVPGYKLILGEFLNDVYLNVKPGLNLLDGIIGLERTGPAATGDPKKVGVIIASENAIALDYVIVKMIHENPYSIYTLLDAKKRNLIDFKKIKIIGELPKTNFLRLQENKKSGKLSGKIPGLIWHELYVHPEIDNSKCDLCGICVKKCPLKAISIKNKKIVFDRKKCRFCYGCEHYCKREAIYMKGSSINKILRFIRKIKGL